MTLIIRHYSLQDGQNATEEEGRSNKKMAMSCSASVVVFFLCDSWNGYNNCVL
jgi:hypothetical protein